jgi:hypothetical protein
MASCVLMFELAFWLGKLWDSGMDWTLSSLICYFGQGHILVGY